MQSTYYVHASRPSKTKVMLCSAAWIAVEQRDRLNRQGWKVTVCDAFTKPLSDKLIAELLLAEARASKPP